MAGFARIEGTFTALVTPFRDDASLSIDWGAFETLVDRQIDAGIDGLVPCGTTGESPALTASEQADLVLSVVRRARGRVKVLAGTGSNSTQHAIDLSRAAERAGADGVMVVVPYYNKPTQEGLYRHFVAIASQVSCPVVVYNIPPRTGVDLLPSTLGRIAEAAKNVVAVKEATGNVLRAQELVRLFGDRLSILCGDDALTLPMISIGARGVISVASNLLPKAIARLTRLALDGRFVEARAQHLALLPVYEALFLEANPGPIKAALALRGLMNEAVRGPLASVTEDTRGKLISAMASYERTAIESSAT